MVNLIEEHDLGLFVKEKLKLDNDVTGNDITRNITGKIELLEKMLANSTPIEKKAREDLMAEVLPYKYDELNLSFLSRSNQVTNGGITFYLPKFGVFREPSMEISLSYIWAFFQGIRYEILFDIDKPKNLPQVVINRLVESVKIPGINEYITKHYRGLGVYSLYYSKDNLSKDEWNRCKAYFKDKKLTNFELDEVYSFKTSVNLVLPDETRDKIVEAKKFFGDNIFFISEIKPEDWSITKIVRDPIAFGTFKDKCFFIDIFDATSPERYIKSEFVTKFNYN